VIRPADHELFRRRIEGAGDVVLVTHINPDGDALGSQFGLAAFLLERGARVRIVNHDPTPELLSFIADPVVPVELYDSTTHDALLASVPTIVLLDNSAPDRLGRMERPMVAAAERTLCIDHHPMRDAPWAETIVDVGSCATAAMVWELTRPFDWTPSARAADAIYVGLATDTGFFRYNSTSSRAHRVAADLLALGVRPARIFRQIYERNSVAFTRLLGHALAGLRLNDAATVASVLIDRELLERLDAEHEDTTEITTTLLALDGVRIVLLFRELAGGGRVKVSLRSKGEIDVHALATEFGGGGHRNASGIVMEGALDEVARIVGARADALAAAHDPPAGGR